MNISSTRLGAVTVACAAVVVFLVSASSSRAGVDPSPSVTCSSPSPCVTDSNTGSGPGLSSLSSQGSGFLARTKFNSTSGPNGKAAVLGIDSSTTGTFDSGVKGISTRGIGVTGLSTSGTAVRAKGAGGNLFVGNGSAGTDVFRVDDAGNVFADGEMAVGNNPSTSFGLEASGTVEGVVGIGLSSNSAAVASTGVSGAALYVATNAFNTQTLRADDSGNLIITGLIFTAGGCSTGCVTDQKQPGTRVVTYAPREAAPTVEDVGEGQLTDGRSYVALDPKFASVIDQRGNYFVFITPEGDNRGLFVTGKTIRGFSVRESQGGRSTLPFSYRIVAQPYGPAQPRLARVNFAAQPRLARFPAPAQYPNTPR